MLVNDADEDITGNRFSLLAFRSLAQLDRLYKKNLIGDKSILTFSF